ncbi:hypothetical protein [Isoptericola sp. NPDC056605]|uniref:hypothetical protein n=1 Tax=Isoptericola sp. NPDC056605 TaxID=3345876 RepID=UPI0036AA7543
MARAEDGRRGGSTSRGSGARSGAGRSGSSGAGRSGGGTRRTTSGGAQGASKGTAKGTGKGASKSTGRAGAKSSAQGGSRSGTSKSGTSRAGTSRTGANASGRASGGSSSNRSSSTRSSSTRGTSSRQSGTRATSSRAQGARRGDRRVATASQLVAPGGSRAGTRSASSRRTTSPRSRKPAPRRSRRSLTVSLLVVVLLCGVGVAGGYGLGQAVDGARSLLAGPESLPADKVAAPEPLNVGGPATTCRADAVELRLSSSAPTVTAGSPMSFMVRVTNVGRVPCLFDGAAASRAVTITDDTGKEKVWSSAECSDGSRPLLLGPEGVDAGEVRWTSVQGCGKKAPVVGAGTYEATASLEDVPGATSEPLTFTVAAKAKARTTPEPGDGAEGATSGATGKDAADDAKSDDAKSDDAKSDDAKSDDAKSDDAKSDDAEDAADRAADRTTTSDEKAATD